MFPPETDGKTQYGETLYFSFVLGLASSSLTWELEMQIIYSHLDMFLYGFGYLTKNDLSLI